MSSVLHPFESFLPDFVHPSFVRSFVLSFLACADSRHQPPLLQYLPRRPQRRRRKHLPNHQQQVLMVVRLVEEEGVVQQWRWVTLACGGGRGSGVIVRWLIHKCLPLKQIYSLLLLPVFRFPPVFRCLAICSIHMSLL